MKFSDAYTKVFGGDSWYEPIVAQIGLILLGICVGLCLVAMQFLCKQYPPTCSLLPFVLTFGMLVLTFLSISLVLWALVLIQWLEGVIGIIFIALVIIGLCLIVFSSEFRQELLLLIMD
jgi:hypothetical protein